MSFNLQSMYKVHRISSVDWRPSAVVALATSADASRVAAARADGSLEIWLVPPGSVGWHCLLTIHGDPNSRVSSLVWCQSGPKGRAYGRLLSSSIDGSVYEWDLFDLRQKRILDPLGVSIWQIAAEPCSNFETNTKQVLESHENGHASCSNNSSIEEEESDCESGDDMIVLHDGDDVKSNRLALACDDGCVRIYFISDDDKLTYSRKLPRVGGRMLSVAWSTDARRIYAGSSDGFIRCWNARLGQEVFRITVRPIGLGSRCDLCIWSLLVLRCGTIVSADSSGSVQFWDGQFGTLLQAHSYHKGDVNALAAAPSHNRVFSAGSDGQVILYKLSSDSVGSGDGEFVPEAKKWAYVGYVRAHTHDVKSLTVAVPINHEYQSPDENVKKLRVRKKPLEFSYHKWAHQGVPMLISAGDDTKLFAYSVKEFTKFSPHDICPAPQKTPLQLVRKSMFNAPMLLIQTSHWIDIYFVSSKKKSASDISFGPSTGAAKTGLIARVKCKDSQKIICSAISSSGTYFAFSDHVKPKLFKLENRESGKSPWKVNKLLLPRELPIAYCMAFTSHPWRLLLAGQDKRIYVVDVESADVVHAFTPCCTDGCEKLPPSELPITKMFTSADGKWLAAANSFGDLYIFNLETLRQHWFLSRLYGASITAGGFTPRNGSVLIVSTSSNQVYALDVEAKKFDEWSIKNTFVLPKKYQEFPGEVIGLSFKPSSDSSSAIIYGPRAMCMIDFDMPADREDEGGIANSHSNGVRKRKQHQLESKYTGKKNAEFCSFKDPVLLLEHLSKDSVLVVDKPWIQVVDSFDAQPVHRHIFGT